MEENTKCNKWLSWVLFLTAPAFSYLIFESLTGALFMIDGASAVLNLLFYYTLYIVAAVLTGRVRMVVLSLNAVLTTLALAEFYVVRFRARPIMLWDMMAWRTAATVAGQYDYSLPPRNIGLLLLMVLFSVLCWKFPLKLPPGRRRIAAASAAVLWAGGWLVFFFQFLVPAKSIDVSMWNPVESYESQGYILCTARMFGYLSVVNPEGYQHAAVSQMYSELGTTPAGNGTVPVNIICIMNESWSDLSVIADFETDEASFDFYRSMTDNAVKGSVYVPVFGSMTSNSEYEFLTGNSMAFAPEGSVPFQIYMKNHALSPLEMLKEQGYRTIGMHPYPGDNWNRAQAYRSLGFDEFLDEPYFDDAPRLRGYVSDRGCFEKVIAMTEANDEEEPLFFFVVTMQNHGGYTQEYEPSVRLADGNGFPQTQQYLSLIRETDQALQYLVEYYQDSDQPTLIMMFGDHQPGIEEEFYEFLYGSPLSELSPEHYLRRFKTPYVIWTNYENNLGEPGDFSVVYLFNQVLKAANLPLNGYQTFLEELKEEAPVIHMIGYYDRHGVWQSWTNWRSKESYGWLQKLDWFQYYRMFDRSRKANPGSGEG